LYPWVSWHNAPCFWLV